MYQHNIHYVYKVTNTTTNLDKNTSLVSGRKKYMLTLQDSTPKGKEKRGKGFFCDKLFS